MQVTVSRPKKAVLAATHPQQATLFACSVSHLHKLLLDAGVPVTMNRLHTVLNDKLGSEARNQERRRPFRPRVHFDNTVYGWTVTRLNSTPAWRRMHPQELDGMRG